MAKGFDDLIEFLLEEIALRGEQGASTSDFNNLTDKFYSARLAHGRAAALPAPTNDRRLQEKVWAWLTAHPDICLENGQTDGIPSLAELETIEDAQNRVASTEASADAEGAAAPSPAAPRLYVNEERMWQAITGHGVDPKKVPRHEFIILSIIAAHGENGVVQPEITRISGQDKRSVPKRTDNLAKHGYITKTHVLAKGTRTSLCTLKTYAKRQTERKRTVPVATSSSTPEEINATIFESGLLLYDRFFDLLMEILKDCTIMTMEDLKRKMGIRSKTWEMKSLWRSMRRLEGIGLIKKVKAQIKSLVSTYRWYRCVKLLRQPTQRDRSIFVSMSIKEAKKVRHTADNGDNADAVDDDDTYVEADDQEQDGASQALVEEGNAVEEIQRLPPQWDPDRPINNLLWEVIRLTGPAGSTTAFIRDRGLGGFYRRPVDSILGRISDIWHVSQPAHLKHFAIIRDTGISDKYIHYVYRTYGNFQLAVDTGDAAWEVVITEPVNQNIGRPKPRAKNTKNVRPTIHHEYGELDEWGFPQLHPSCFEGHDGMATLHDCNQSVFHDLKLLPSRGYQPKFLRDGFLTTLDHNDESSDGEDDPGASQPLPSFVKPRRKYTRKIHEPGKESHPGGNLALQRKEKKLRQKAEQMARIELLKEKKDAGLDPGLPDTAMPKPKRVRRKSKKAEAEADAPMEDAPAAADDGQDADNAQTTSANAEQTTKAQEGTPSGKKKTGRKRQKSGKGKEAGKAEEMAHELGLLGIDDELITQRAQLILERLREQDEQAQNVDKSKPGVYINPPGAEKPRDPTLKGRPKKTMILVITLAALKGVDFDAPEFAELVEAAKVRAAAEIEQRRKETEFERVPPVTQLVEGQFDKHNMDGSMDVDAAETTAPARQRDNPFSIEMAASTHQTDRPSTNLETNAGRTVSSEPPIFHLLDEVPTEGPAQQLMQAAQTPGEAGTAAATPKPVPKKRGRPPKDPNAPRRPRKSVKKSAEDTAPTAANAPDLTVEPATAAAQTNPDAGDDAVATAAVVGTPVPRRRGRKPKTVAPSPVQIAVGSVASGAAVETPVPKKRGRKPKTVAPFPAEVDGESVASGTAVETTAPEGRGRKPETLAPSPAEIDGESVGGGAAVETTGPEKRDETPKAAAPDAAGPMTRRRSSVQSNSGQPAQTQPPVEKPAEHNPFVAAVDEYNGGVPPPISPPKPFHPIVVADQEHNETITSTPAPAPAPAKYGSISDLLPRGPQGAYSSPYAPAGEVFTNPNRSDIPIKKKKGKWHGGKKQGVKLSSGGILNFNRTKLLVSIIEKCEGVFPGDFELHRPFTALWRKEYGSDRHVDRDTIKRTIKNALDSGKLRRLTYSFKNKSGVMMTRHILTTPNVDSRAPLVIETQQNVIAAWPRVYTPPQMKEFEEEVGNSWYGARYEKDTTVQVQRTALPQWMQDIELRTAENQKKRDEERRRRLEREAKDSSLPSTGGRGGRGRGRGGRARGGVTGRTRLAALPRPATDPDVTPWTPFQTSFHVPPETESVEETEYIPPPTHTFEDSTGLFRVNNFVFHNPAESVVTDDEDDDTSVPGTPSSRASRSRRSSVASIQPPSGRPSFQVNLSPSPSRSRSTTPIRPPSRGATFRVTPSPSRRSSIHSTSSSRPGTPPVQRFRLEKPAAQQFLFKNSGPEDYDRDWDMQRVITLTDPGVRFYPSNGTFSTEYSIVRNARLSLWVQPRAQHQQEFEDAMPKSLEQLLSSVRMKGKERDHSRRGNQDLSRFEREIIKVSAWEEQSAKREDVGLVLKQPHFINHTFFGNHLRPESEASLTPLWNNEDSQMFTPFRPPPFDEEDESDIGSNFFLQTARGQGLSAGFTGFDFVTQPLNRRRRTVPVNTPDARAASRTAKTGQKNLAPRQSNSSRAPYADPLCKISNADTKKLLYAMVIVQTLVGGVENFTSWETIRKIFRTHDHWDLTSFRNRWVWLKSHCADVIEQLFQEFQEAYLLAYECGDVPSLNYEKPDEYEWEFIVDWAMQNLAIKPPKQADAAELPTNRRELDKEFVVEEVNDQYGPPKDTFYNEGTVYSRRKELAELYSFHVPLTYPPQPKPRTRQGFSESALERAKTWVRATIVVPDRQHNPEIARAKLSTLAPKLIEKATADVISTKFFRDESKGRSRPGRAYGIDKSFTKAFERQLTATQLLEAMQFKQHLDTAFRSGAAAFPLLPAARDGHFLAVTNLAQSGWVKRVPRLPPVDHTVGKPFPRLSKWGFTEGHYKTVHMDRGNLNWDMEIVPTQNYIFGNPLMQLHLDGQPSIGGGGDNGAARNCFPPLPLPAPGSEHDGFLPLWYSIEQHPMREWWRRVVTAIIHVVLGRPGVGINNIKKALKDALGAWEVELCVEWLKKVGALKDMRLGLEESDPTSGFRLGEWWWCVLGDEA